MKIKNICCIAAGYVGGPTMAVISQKCTFIKVNVVDKDSNKIDKLNLTNLNELPVYELAITRNKLIENKINIPI